MKFKKQRLLAAALAAVLTVSMGAVPVEAAELNTSEIEASEDVSVEDQDTVTQTEVQPEETTQEEHTEEVVEQETTDEEDGQAEAVEEDSTEEIADVQETKEELQAVDVVTQADEISYVYVEQPQLETPDTQNVVISFAQEDLDIRSASLTVRNEETQETERWDAAEIQGYLTLFSKEYTEGTGIYRLISLDYVVGEDEVQKSITLADYDLGELTFAVNEDLGVTYISQDGQAEDTGVEAQIVKMDEQGAPVGGETIEAALGEASQQVAQVAAQRATAGSRDVVVVLDPGHDSSHKGTHGGGLQEHDLTLSIAWYCRDVLEKYDGVKVYMTRETAACPYPGKSSTEDNKARVDFAARVGADIYVSIHLNSSPNAAVSGAEVYYPNSNYQSWMGTEGRDLSNKILNELGKLGLKKRSVTIRNSQDGTTYPDGSLADYYAVIRRSKEKGFPGIIVEHAFMSSSSDVNNFLNSEAKLKKLGQADAAGIAKYLGLDAGNDFSYDSFGVENLDTENGKFDLVLSGLKPVSKISKIQYVVWNEKSGSDKAITYEGIPSSDGTFRMKIEIANHGNVRAKYHAEAYAVDAAGISHRLANTSCTIPTYSDVPETSGWRYDAIKYVVDNGIMNGISGTARFAPDEALTRAMFATIIYRMDGSPQISYNGRFPDVPYGNYYSLPVSWASSVGIINGHSNTGMFGSNENITREDMVTILYRYVKYKDMSLSGGNSLSRFPDASQVSGYAREAMQWAVANGIISGRSNTGMLDPKGNASRVECAAIIQRFRNNIR